MSRVEEPHCRDRGCAGAVQYSTVAVCRVCVASPLAVPCRIFQCLAEAATKPNPPKWLQELCRAETCSSAFGHGLAPPRLVHASFRARKVHPGHVRRNVVQKRKHKVELEISGTRARWLERDRAGKERNRGSKCPAARLRGCEAAARLPRTDSQLAVHRGVSSRVETQPSHPNHNELSRVDCHRSFFLFSDHHHHHHHPRPV